MAKATNGKKQELPENERPQEEIDLAKEFAALGKKFAEALDTAWNSQERHNIQKEMTAALNRMAADINQAATKVRESEVGQKTEAAVQQIAEDVRTGKAAEEVRKGLVKALHGLGEAIDKMTESMTSTDETPKKK